MGEVPEFVRQWADQNDVEFDELHAYLARENDPDWEVVVEDELYDEEKYNNVSERVLRHVPSGRFVRVWVPSLPYGIEGYGMAPIQSYDINEVFPVTVTRTEYRTREEQAVADAEPDP